MEKQEFEMKLYFNKQTIRKGGYRKINCMGKSAECVKYVTFLV